MIKWLELWHLAEESACAVEIIITPSDPLSDLVNSTLGLSDDLAGGDDDNSSKSLGQYSRYDWHFCFMSVKKFSTPHFFDLEAKFGFKWKIIG